MMIYGVIFFIATATAIPGPPCTTTNEGIFPHEDECQLYYDCSKPGFTGGRGSYPHLYECDYPNLFDSNQNGCVNFENVDCGDRKVILDICGTMKYRHAHAHGRPCRVDKLDCEGLADGKHPFPNRFDSPYYAECYKERFMGKNECRDANGQYTRFDPKTKECEGADDN